MFIASVAEGLSGRATSSVRHSDNFHIQSEMKYYTNLHKRHYNGTIGACGCGDENGAYPWQVSIMICLSSIAT